MTHRRSPEDVALRVNLGRLLKRTGLQSEAFQSLGYALSLNPFDVDAILAANSIIQANHDYEVALAKYRVAAVEAPESPIIWNNIALVFLGKGKLIAAIGCLKRALYLAPFEWRISANLGLLFLKTGQYASAFHHFNLATQTQALSPQREVSLTASHMEDNSVLQSLASASLALLGDTTNAQKAFAKVQDNKGAHPLALINCLQFHKSSCDERSQQSIKQRLRDIAQSSAEDEKLKAAIESALQ